MKSTKASNPTAETSATFLQPCDPEKLRWEMQTVQLAIARRAFELFEKRNREHGHDWEDWFQAESELLRPVSVATLEGGDRLSLRANVSASAKPNSGSASNPSKLSSSGKKRLSTETEGGKIEYIDWYPDQILRVIDLPVEVDPEGAVVELQAGLLKFELPKAVKKVKESATVAA